MDREIKLIHTADSHIGYRQYHSEVRRQDFLDAFSTVISDAIEMQVDAVIHAGDLFDSRNPTLDDILDTMNILSRLKTAGIPFLAIVGNHESKQYTQWLDLFAEMGIAIRLGTAPYTIGEVAVYGIDSVPKSKIPLFDYSVFDSAGSDAHHNINILVMHQLMKPFAFGEWDPEDVIRELPFDVHAMLLGDYHKYEKTKVGDTWVTYCGSTERNSAAEREVRSYNIITINSAGIDISRRNIPTREFVFVPVTVTEDTNVYEGIFGAIKEHDIEDKVVFVEISGDPKIQVSYSEIEEFLLNRNALVPRIRDLRTAIETLSDVSVDVSFSDPDVAVKEEIKKMDLTDGGMLIDEIVRDPGVVKSKVDAHSEERITRLVERMDFTNPVPHTRGAVVVKAAEDEAESSDAAKDEAEPSGDTKSGTKDDTKDDDEGDAAAVIQETVTETPGKPVPANATETPGNEKITEKTVKSKARGPVPKQYNLGDYL